MTTSTSGSTSSVRCGFNAARADASDAPGASDRSPSEPGVSSSRSLDASQTGKDVEAATIASPPQQMAGTAPGRTSDEKNSARAMHSGRSARTIPTAVALSSGATAAPPATRSPPADGGSTPADTLPGATVAEFAELARELDGDDRNSSLTKIMQYGVGQEMTGYPLEVVHFEQRLLDTQRLLIDLPESEREFFGSALAAVNEAYKLETDSVSRQLIDEKARELDLTIRNAHARVMSDPVDRTLSVFNPPLGQSALRKEDRDEVDHLERLREDFFDAADSAERKAIFRKAAELKAHLQQKIGMNLDWGHDGYGWKHEEWSEANREVDRILREAETQSDPAKRYELIGRQLFQLNPGQDRLKDKVVLAFTQRMHDSQALRDKLNAWHAQVTAPLNAHSVGGPKRYTDILKNLPPVGPDYLRDLSNLYTDVLRDASHRNYSITPKARAEKLATQILEGVMRVLGAVTPLGILTDTIPSSLPQNVQLGIEFAGMLLDTVTGLGAGKQVGRAAKALASSARKADLDTLAGAGVRARVKGLVANASERILQETRADETLSAEALAASQKLETKALAEAGPSVDTYSALAHEAVGNGLYGSLANYADPNVVPGKLQPGSQAGVLQDSKGDRFIELGGKAYHVRYDSDNGTWRVFDKSAPWKPQYPVRLNAATRAWEVHSDVGLAGGAPEISESLEQQIVALLEGGEMSQRKIAATTGATRYVVELIARKHGIDPRPAVGISETTRQQAIELLNEGKLSRSEIAERLHISRVTVGKLAKHTKIVPLRKENQGRKLTKETTTAVIAKVRAGETNDKIAKDLGISPTSVSRIRVSIQMRSGPAAAISSRRLSSMRPEIIKQLQGGASLREVARSVGASYASVWRIAKQLGIRGRGPGRGPLATRDQIDQVFALRDKRHTARQVAAATGLSESRVRDIYSNVNAETYKRSWWDTTPGKRTAVLRQLDAGTPSNEIAKDTGLPLETIRGIANQHRMARDTLASELLSQGKSVQEVAQKLDISPQYVERLKGGVPEGTHDIHLNSEEGAVAKQMFGIGCTREEVAEKLGISLWRAHSLANEYTAKTMDSVMPKQLADIVAALNDESLSFTTQDLARGTGLPEATVMVVEHEYEAGHIISHAGSPQPGPSQGAAGSGVTLEWIRPLSLEQQVEAIRAADDGKHLMQVANEVHVDRAAIDRLYDEDLPLVAPADDPADPLPAGAMPPAAVSLTQADIDEIRKLARDNQFSPEFISNFLEVPLLEVKKALG
ncbi:ArsR family transcriptional regulator [Paraburkholderia azotifigens]|uniref:ArsR family transcriptional regulator n=1 Tax=Paraburkholderia azotifigens TaxID=2057004 RepID=UPI00317F6E20